MKKLLTLLLLLPLLIFAQVPQGVGYQGVATDALGTELVNQSISIRASILSGSATGNIEWQETHNTSTDTFGLFNLTIGQGTSTGNGVQSSFADISWGANTHFLKIEMDVNGGTNYSFMGTNQMMSVPYALYAENANIDYDSIATLLSNDSSFINTFEVGGNMVFGDFEDITSILSSSITNINGMDWSAEFQQNQDGFIFGKYTIINNSSSLCFRQDSLSGYTNYMQMSVEREDVFCFPIKKDNVWSFRYYNATIDKIYWVPLESGGGTSSTTISSNSVGDFAYPDGKDNITPIIHDLSTSTYTVPAGKNLYITSYQGINSTDELQISSNTVFKGRGQYSNGQGVPVGLFELPMIASSSEIVSAPGKMNGFLVDASIAPINFSLSGNYVNNITYTVPAGKILVLLNFYSAMNGGYGSLQADGMFQLYGIFNYYDNISGCSPGCESTNIKNPLFFDENTIISTEGWGDLQIINGYLMDK